MSPFHKIISIKYSPSPDIILWTCAAQLAVRIIRIRGVRIGTQIADSDVLRIISICMTICGNKSVCGVINEALNSVIEHIAVHIIGHILSVEHHQAVVGVVLETAIGSIGHIACYIISVHFFRQYNVAQILGGSLDYAIEVIISIAQFPVFVKNFDKNSRTRKCG